MILPLVVLVLIAAAIGAGIYVTVRGFKASAARHAQLNGGRDAANHAHASIAHDQSQTGLLKQFFDGKSCAICRRAIAPVQRTGPKPGLLNPQTNETLSWDHIPNENLAASLDTHRPLCADCVLTQSLHQHHPDLIVDRGRPHHGEYATDRGAVRP